MNIFTSKLRAIGVFNKRELIALQGSIFQRSFHPTLARQKKKKKSQPFLNTQDGFTQVLKELVHVRESLQLPDDRMPHFSQLLKHSSSGGMLVNAIKEHHGGFGMVAIKMGWLTRQQAKGAKNRAEKGLPPLSKEEMITALSVSNDSFGPDATIDHKSEKSARRGHEKKKKRPDIDIMKLENASLDAGNENVEDALENNRKSKLCRYGNKCSRKDCWFTHPRDVSGAAATIGVSVGGSKGKTWRSEVPRKRQTPNSCRFGST